MSGIYGSIRRLKMKSSFSVATLSAGILLAISTSSNAAFIDFNTQQNGTPYVGLGGSFVAAEYNGVVINDSDITPGSTYVNQTNAANVGTAINGYYVNVGAFSGIQTQLTLDFTTAVTSVSFDFANPQGYLTVTAFDTGGGVLSVFNAFSTGVFINQAGFNQGSGHVDVSGLGNIGSLLIEPNFNEALIFDNLRFEPVPVPAALPLLLSGLIGLGMIKRRTA
jgi:hypothetical protein